MPAFVAGNMVRARGRRQLYAGSQNVKAALLGIMEDCGFPDQSFDEQPDRLIERKRQLSRHMPAPPTGELDIEALFKGTVKE
jgi:hypothetical protein